MRVASKAMLPGPGRGQPWVAAGFNLRMAEATRYPNPNGVELTDVRPLQGRNYLSASLSAGFTYGYSRYPASREGDASNQTLLTPPREFTPAAPLAYNQFPRATSKILPTG
ncbi:MAG: hypothetical protein ABSA59_09630 [Terriglobia bacterium]|jgi:hypothetical protein